MPFTPFYRILLNQNAVPSVKGFLHFFAKLYFSAQTLC